MSPFAAPGVPAALVVAATLVAGGCSTDNPQFDGGTDGNTASCTPPNVKTSRAAVAVSSASASFVDANSQAVPGVIAAVVGLDLASTFATSGADGKVQIAFTQSSKAPIFRYGDGLKFPMLGIPIDAGMGMISFVNLPVAPLPSQGVSLAAGATLTSGDLTLTTEAGTTILIDTLSYPNANDQLLRAASQPGSVNLYQDTHDLGLALLVGVAPAGTILCPPARVTLVNRPGWPAGTPVELFTQGIDVGEQYAPYGEWLSLGDGTVSSDGKSLVFGQALKALAPLAVRKKL